MTSGDTNRMPEFALLKQLLNEEGKTFPPKLEVVCGKTLVKTGTWWKAILLVKVKYGEKEKYQLRLYGWQWSKKDNRYKNRQKFNISPARYLGEVISALQVFMQESIKGGKYTTIAEKLTEKLSNFQAELSKMKRLNQKNKIPEMENKIKEFALLLKKKKVKEKELQKFLYKQFWMFGSHYQSVCKEEAAGMKGRTDFLIQKQTGYYDIIELKKPEHHLFTKGKFPTMSKEFKDAISQMARYFDYYHKHYLSYRDEQEKDVLYPKGIIVIGRRKEEEKKLLKSYDLIFHRVEILTYDDILDGARQAIKTIKKRKQ